MPKKIHQKYWSFQTEVKLPSVEKKESFLWWSWTYVINPTEFKYPNEAALLDEVNQFIADNDIDEIISFKNTAGYITLGSYESDYTERRGGIELTYFK